MATKHADDNGPFKEFVFGDWLFEQFEDFCGQVKCGKGRMKTTEFEAHMRNAAKEQLLAMRSIVDGFIEIIEEKEGAKTKET